MFFSPTTTEIFVDDNKIIYRTKNYDENSPIFVYETMTVAEIISSFMFDFEHS